jgi:hypothetical protein
VHMSVRQRTLAAQSLKPLKGLEPVEIVSQITLLRRLPAIFAGVGYLITAPPSAVIGD